MIITKSQVIPLDQPEKLSLKKREELRVKIIVEILIEFIYNSTTLFEFRDFPDDGKSEFLIAVHKALPRLIANYDESKGKFLTYLVSYVRMMAKGYRRIIAKASAVDDSAEYCWCLDCEKGFEAREEEPEYAAPADAAASPDDEKRGLAAKSTELALIVLALKNSFTITEKQVNFIAEFTGYDREKLNGIVETARQALLPREKARDRLIEGRNHAFFQKTRYRIEMERLKVGCSQYVRVQKQFDYYSALLDRKNEILKTKYKLCPSNKYIGEALDIPPRNVGRILDEAERTFRQASHRLAAGDFVS